MLWVFSQTTFPSNSQHLLVSCIEEQLRSLEKMRDPLQNEIQENATRGQALELLVREHCQPLELERYSLFIGDLERVVSLLLCLSARLARVQNALSTVDQHTDIEEKVRNHNSFKGFSGLRCSPITDGVLVLLLDCPSDYDLGLKFHCSP